MDIKIIDNDMDFLFLKDDWNQLVQIAPYEFDWIYKWWQQFKDNNSLSIVVATEDNNVIGIAPFYVQNYRLYKFFTYKRLCFLGGTRTDNITDNMDFFITDKQDRELIFKNLFDFVVNTMPFDTLDLQQISTHSPNFPLWHKYSNSLGFKPEIHMVNLKIRLSSYDSYDEYYSQLSINTKKHLKNHQNRARKSFNNVEYIFKNDITPEDIDTVARIDQKRQDFLTSKGDDHRYCYFADPRKDNFLRDYFCSDNSNSKLLAYLKLDGNVAASLLSLMNKNIFAFWHTTFDQDFSDFSPSILLLNEQIKYAFENHFEYFDFLGGSEDYKFKWANQTFALFNIKYDKTIKKNLAFRYNF